MSNPEQTQHQSDDDRKRSRDLSLASTKPPGKIAGYSVEQFIGKGAYGEVWSGTEKKTGRRVAIKFYSRRTSDDVEQLAREVEKLVALAADRYVVQLVDVDWQASPPYFVMDYFERGSLEDLLKKEQTLTVGRAEDIFCEIAMGLMHLHGKGIFHCDLKPANILLDDDEKPRLADFGQSRLTTEKGPSLGTLFYMAPEQADLKVVPAARWDVYALGAIFYAMLVGKPPYQDHGLTEKLESSVSVEDRLAHYRKALKSAPLPTEHRKLPGVDRALADIIDRAIAPNPSRRFDSVQSVMFAMRQRETAKARRPLMVLGILGPLLLLLVMSAFAWFTYDQTYSHALEAIDKEANDTNNFAATLAASSAAAKISEYFRAVGDLARDDDFIDAVIVAVNNTMLNEKAQILDDPNGNADEALKTDREVFREQNCLEPLQAYMNERIKNEDNRYPQCASWFVNDRRGNQLASAFTTKPDINTIGRNYSYRTYFTGLDRDRRTEEDDGSRIFDVEPLGTLRPIIDRPHLSAVFLSRGTSTWKIAFSVPLMDEKDEIIGIVACTAEMGKFVELDFGSDSQYAALIDGRPGENTGAILEHPFFRISQTNPRAIPKVSNIKKITESKRFVDPISALPNGEPYDREWIAALKSVELTDPDSNSNAGDNKKKDSGLFVMVAEDAKAVFEPVTNLSAQLVRLASFAALFFVFVAVTMWLMVLRMFKDTGSRLDRSFSTADSSFNVGSTGSVAR